MKLKILEHFFSFLLITVMMIALLVFLNYHKKQSKARKYATINEFINLQFIDLKNPFHKELFNEALTIYYPGQDDRNTKIINTMLQYQEDKFSENIKTAYLQESLNGKKMMQLLGMYAKFLFIYVVVMVLTYYGVQTLGVWRFVRKKNSLFKTPSTSKGQKFVNIGKNIVKGLSYFVLFSPAYVIAYTLRTEFNTDSLLFMILLGVISNGLLVMYANKFYTFLVAESRKGYVETAVVKNLHSSYAQDDSQGIPYRTLFRPRKHFEGHIFHHIFKNARHQYFSTIKEQATFLITGLIIIEMALNIHGYLNYEMLRQILFKNYDIVIVIILGIFYTVKFTEIFTDVLMHRESLKYENRMN